VLSGAFAVISTHRHWALVVDYDSFSLCVIHKEGLCPSSGDINRLMMITLISDPQMSSIFLQLCLHLWKYRKVFYLVTSQNKIFSKSLNWKKTWKKILKTSGRRPVLKQLPNLYRNMMKTCYTWWKHVIPTPLSGIRVEKRRYMYVSLFYHESESCQTKKI
jgi:hypothetical protein